MEKFSDEVLLHIFSELSLEDLLCGVQLVCWRWNRLSKDASLWAEWDLSDMEVNIGADKRDQIKVHHGVRNVLMGIQSCLQHLTFGAIRLDGGIFELFGSSRKKRAKFSALKSLDYSHSYASLRNLQVALKNHPFIEHLYLVCCNVSLLDAVKEIVHLPNLKVFMYDDDTCEDDDDGADIEKFYLLEVPQMCVKLEFVQIFSFHAEIDDEVIQEFTKHCPNLTTLSLSCPAQITSEAFKFVDTSTSCIKSLCLKDRFVTGPYLDFVLPSFPHLTCLSTNGQSIYLEDCIAIGDCCPNLQKLVFHGSRLCNKKTPLCGYELIVIAEKCKLLQKLHAPGTNIDDGSVQYLAEQCPLLEDVDLSKCPRLTDASLWALSKHSKNLVKLGFRNNKVSLESLLCLVKKCRKMYELFADGYLRSEMGANTSQIEITERFLQDSSNIRIGTGIEDISFTDMPASVEDWELRDLLSKIECSSSQSDASINPAASLTSSFLPIDNDYPPVVLHNHSPVKRLSLAYIESKEDLLISICVECPSLTYLSLDSVDALTDSLLICISKRCPNVVFLILSLHTQQSSEGKFGDAGLLAVASHCTQLEDLEFNNNRNITSEAMRQVFGLIDISLRKLISMYFCAGTGFACSPSVVALHGLKHLTENSKKRIKYAASREHKGYFAFGLDFIKRKINY